MLGVTIHINGQPIFARTAVNKGRDAKTGLTKYLVDTGETILHAPDDGVVVLTRKLLDTIKEQ